MNAFIDNIGGEDPSASLLPPEFHIFGVKGKKLKHWHPIDTLSLSRLIALHLTWNFQQDFTREVVRQQHPTMEALYDEMIPFETDFLHNLVSILDD